jgi:MFS family permease
MNAPPSTSESGPWYRDISGYQWLVLLLASAGWLFDVYEGQIYNLTRDGLFLHFLPGEEAESTRRFYGDVFLAAFLLGGALGGIAFGALADRLGRRPILVATILTYSVFSGLTYFADALWQVAVMRFLVALGVGGEWSVASALVAETFPTRARAQAGSIFHATSIVGTWLAALAALAVGSNWRAAYLIGVLPALLVVAVRLGVSEPARWVKYSPLRRVLLDAERRAAGSVIELLSHPLWRGRAIGGLLLAAVGLGTFWGVTIEGQGLARDLLVRQGVDPDKARQQAQFAFGIVQTTGGGLGLLAFGPLSARFGRRWAFLFLQLGSLAVVPLACYAPRGYGELLILLPVYGFFTLGMHAGFAVYFPELFPGSLRATGAGFCFNGGRVVAASVMVFSGWLKNQLDLRLSITLLSGLFLLGVLIVCFLPETKDQPLPE